MIAMDMTGLPGADLIAQGLSDLENGVDSLPAALVAIGAPRLRRLGLAISGDLPAAPEKRLYALLEVDGSDSAHSRYNALVRRLVSFERAAACAASSTATASRV